MKMDFTKLGTNKVEPGVRGKHFLYYGLPSTRKTSVAVRHPRTLLLATEIGYKMIPGVTAVNIKSWADFRAAVRELKRPQVQEMFDTIAIDTISILYDMCYAYICQAEGIDAPGELGYGMGWKKIKLEFKKQIMLLAQMGYSVVFTAHSKEKDVEVKNPDGTVTNQRHAEPKIDNLAQTIVMELVDFVFYLNKEPLDGVQEPDPFGDNTTVYAYSQLPDNIITKTRLRNLDRRFEFTFENLENVLNKAISQLDEVDDSGNIKNYYEDNKVDFDSIKAEIVEHIDTLRTMKESEPTLGGVLQEIEGYWFNLIGEVAPTDVTVKDHDKLIIFREKLIELTP